MVWFAQYKNYETHFLCTYTHLRACTLRVYSSSGPFQNPYNKNWRMVAISCITVSGFLKPNSGMVTINWCTVLGFLKPPQKMGCLPSTGDSDFLHAP